MNTFVLKAWGKSACLKSLLYFCFRFSGCSMTVVHIGAKPQGSNQSGYHVHYLDRQATGAFPNVKLVSIDGKAFKLNSALLALMSSVDLRLLLSARAAIVGFGMTASLRV